MRPEIFGEREKNDKYDFIIIGAGPNGLAVAGYLAKAGQKVLVLERRDIIGGAAMTEEIIPGCKINTHSQFHGWLHYGPVPEDLEIEKYGCRYIFPDVVFAAVFEDETGFVIYKDLEKTIKEIERFSKKDAKTYRETFHEFKELNRIFVNSWFNPPASYSEMFAPLEGTEEGQWIIRDMLANVGVIANNAFESEKLKSAILYMAIQGANLVDMNTTGTMYHMYVMYHERPWAIAEGGSRSLPLALSRFIAAHGGVVQAGKDVTKIIIEKGTAVGVECADGERIMAEKAVVSNVAAPVTVLELIGEDYLAPNTIRGAKGFEWDKNTAAIFYLALNNPIDYKAAKWNPDVNRALGVGVGFESVEDFQRLANEIKENKDLSKPGGFTANFTLYDPSQAPPNKHLVDMWYLCCYDLDGDVKNWDLRKEEIMDRITAAWSRYANNLNKDNIWGRCIYTPYDITKNYPNMRKGSMMLGDVSMYQMYSYRPWPGAANYKIKEISNLYLTGGTTHPTGGVHCGCGYNTVNQIAKDLNIRRWWEK
jgi:phytoene dehydrogenase-like protein